MKPTNTITFASPHHLKVGYYVKLSLQPNRLRRMVRTVDGAFVVDVETFTRPSRGYARHVRRMKQAKRGKR